ncbi:hypothetical protein [Halomicrobium urmianum]|uniref:hypothetical protein n=1 Tax=Halomicrobium urmianum TaxID=1586233 RepID=UPI001CDA1DC5|nr:hypothetical protein [Halomicrobium urmianum]
MSGNDTNEKSSDEIVERIEGAEWYSLLAKIGFGIILLAFFSALIAVLPTNLDSISAAVNSILMPLIFVGMGFLLLGIAMHLHLLHLNLIRQIQKQMDKPDDEDDGT